METNHDGEIWRGEKGQFSRGVRDGYGMEVWKAIITEWDKKQVSLFSWEWKKGQILERLES